QRRSCLSFLPLGRMTTPSGPPCPPRPPAVPCRQSRPGAGGAMAILMPFHGWLLALTTDEPATAPGLPGAPDGAVELADWHQPARVVPRHFDPDVLRANPVVESVAEVWMLRETDELFHEGLTGEFYQGPTQVCLYFDLEHIVGDLSQRYEPYRVLLDLREDG